MEIQAMGTVSPARRQAEAALTALHGRTDRAARAEGDQWLGSVEASGDLSEKTVAQAVREATAQKMKDPSAATAQQVALQAVSGGLGGPASVALAHTARQIVAAVATSRPADAAAIASTLVGHMSGTGLRATDALLAETVKLAGDNCLDRTAAVHVYDEGLRLLEAPAPERLEVTLSRFGAAAREHCSSGDARAMGQLALQQIEKYTADPKVRALAHAGFEGSISSGGWPGGWGTDDGAASVQRRAFEDIRAAASQIDETEKQAMRDELERIAAHSDAPPAGTVEVKDDSVVIGGVRIDRRH